MKHVIFKTITMALIVLLIFPFSATAKQKKGAKVVIHTMDGQRVKGELLRVKDGDLLIMEQGVNTEATFSIEEIGRIRIKRKDKFLKAVGIGFAIGAGAGATMGLVTPLDDESGLFYSTKSGQVAFAAFFMGILGLGVGTLFGLASSPYNTYMVHSRGEKQKQELLMKLKKKARFQ